MGGNKCVICAGNKNLKVMHQYNIENVKNNKLNIIKTLQKCFDLNFPKRNAAGKLNRICMQCIDKLKLCYEFHESVKVAHQTLYSAISCKEAAKPEEIVHVQDIKNEEELIVKKEEISEDDNILLNSFLEDDNTEYDDKYEDIIHNDAFSDCSTNTEEIFVATGYYSQRESSNKNQNTERTILKKDCVECPVCKERFYNYNLTNRHYVTHFPTDLCYICGKTTSTKLGFKRHIQTHEEKTDKHFCELCNISFKTDIILSRHIRHTHKRIKAIRCYHCPEQFSGSLSRLIHMHRAHNVECEMFPCTKCDMKFYAKTALRRHHDRVHAKMFRFYCDACSIGFYDRRDLSQHIKYKHENKDLLKCNICGKTFARPRNLNSHMKIHLNIKDHKCTLCEQAFVQKSSLIYHLKKHHKQV